MSADESLRRTRLASGYTAEGEVPSMPTADDYARWAAEDAAKLREEIATHPPTSECPLGPLHECHVCGARDCPQGEPGRYWKDGCPACNALP